MTTYQNVLSRIQITQTGDFARNDFDGSIGGKLLLSHKLTVDYPNRKIYIEPSASNQHPEQP